ncbi:MAG TPA: flagellar basal-body MS-ring/collar protein FliF [Polyangia bacterium]|jgi:flagellar M-ring protein FliF
MEPVLKSIRDASRRYAELNAATRMLLAGVLSLATVIAVVAIVFSTGSTYQYAFTNLGPEDSTDAAAALKAAGISFRTEAGGSALSVPASQVHEARLMLAAQGLPRGGGVGFELFDRGDFGASEFTQRVNLRRATEGELARTLSRLQSVRSARVHVTLPEKGLYRDDDRRASAAVVLNMQPGRNLQERELAGVRHLVASAVAGLNPDSVTVVDQRGTVLSGDLSASAKQTKEQRDIESGLEQRITDLLEPAVGRGAIVAKVTATLDTTEIETTQDNYDPDSATVRSEHKTTETVNSDGTTGSGVAGAAANQPVAAVPGGGAGASRTQTARDDEVRNYEITKKVTHTITRSPRIVRLSAAVLVDGLNGKARPEADVRRLSDLAKHAIGFDDKRGDVMEISSAPFTKLDESAVTIPIWDRADIWRLGRIILWGILATLGMLLVFRVYRRATSALAFIKPGSRVGDVQMLLGRGDAAALPAMGRADALVLREQARELSKTDPARAANLLRAWVDSDGNQRSGSTTEGAARR